MGLSMKSLLKPTDKLWKNACLRKQMQGNPSGHQMVSARQEAHAAQSLNECTNTEEDKEPWSQALSNLYKVHVYDQVREVEL